MAPDFAVAHHNISLAYLEKGDYEAAVRHSDQAMALGYDVPAEIRKEIDKHR
jgi:hypothetical protein